MKNYNARALRGDAGYTDVHFQNDMRKQNIHIPDNKLFTPEMNTFAVEAMRKQNISNYMNNVNPDTGQTYSADEATSEANSLARMAKENLDRLMTPTRH